MKAVSSSFDDSTDSQEKLEARTKILNQQIQVQDQRVQMLQKGVEAAAKEFGDGATQTLKWEQALNEAKSALNGMKSNLSNLENGVEDVTEELEDGEQASFGFGDALKAGALVQHHHRGREEPRREHLRSDGEHQGIPEDHGFSGSIQRAGRIFGGGNGRNL